MKKEKIVLRKGRESDMIYKNNVSQTLSIKHCVERMIKSTVAKSYMDSIENKIFSYHTGAESSIMSDAHRYLVEYTKFVDVELASLRIPRMIGEIILISYNIAKNAHYGEVWNIKYAGDEDKYASKFWVIGRTDSFLVLQAYSDKSDLNKTKYIGEDDIVVLPKKNIAFRGINDNMFDKHDIIPGKYYEVIDWDCCE